MIEVVNAMFWLAANGLLGSAAWRWVTVAFANDTLEERVQHAIVLSWTAVIVAAIALSSVSALTGIGLVLLIAMASLVAILACSAVTKSRASDARPTNTHYQPLRGWNLFWIGMGAWLVARLGITVALPIYPYCWDTLDYHLPFVDHWLHARSLYAPTAMKWFFPGNSEIVALWMTGVYSGNFLAVLNNLPAVALLAASSLVITKQLRFPRSLRHLTTLAVMTNSLVWYQTVSNKNDLAVAATFLAAIAYLIRATQLRGRHTLSMFLLSIGILAGIKYYALLYAAWLVCVLLLSQWMLGARTPTRQPFWVYVAFLVANLTGGYWYSRNWIVSGRPMYPKSILPWAENAQGANENYFGTTLFGRMWTNQSLDLIELWQSALWKATGPVHWFAAATLPAALIVLALVAKSFMRTARRRRAIRFLALFALCGGAVVQYAVTPFVVGNSPFDYQFIQKAESGFVAIRLGFPFITLMLLCSVTAGLQIFQLVTFRLGASAYGYYRHAPWIIAMTIFSLLCVLQAINFHRDVDTLIDPTASPSPQTVALFTILLYFTFGVAFILLGVRRAACGKWTSWEKLGVGRNFDFAAHSIQPWFRWAACAVIVLTFWSVAMSTVSQRWHAGFDDYYREKLSTDSLLVLADEKFDGQRVCVLSSKSFPFFGSRRQHIVAQVYHMSALPDPIRDSRELESYIIATKSQWLVAGRGFNIVVDKLLSKGHIDQFWIGDNYQIYRIHPIR